MKLFLWNTIESNFESNFKATTLSISKFARSDIGMSPKQGALCSINMVTTMYLIRKMIRIFKSIYRSPTEVQRN